MPGFFATTRLSGAFFRHNAEKEVLSALTEALRDLVAEGERLVKLQLYPGHGLILGHYRRAVNGEMLGDYHGVIHDTDPSTGNPVIYGPWLEGVSSLNARSRFKGYAMFRKARQRIDEIAEETLDRHIGAAVGRLT